MASQFIKDPNAVLDYKWDWGAEWLPAGDTISTADVILTSGDVAINSESNTTTTVTAWISGGTMSTKAQLTARVVTAQGRTADRTITLLIDQT
jgi:hypothetical protein